MLFDSALYIWFLVIVVVGYWLMARKEMARTLWLLLASYMFYASWNAKFLGLIVLSTAIDYVIGLSIYRASEQRIKLRLLWLSIAVNLGLLGLFKYLGFFLETTQDLASLAISLGLLEFWQSMGLFLETSKVVEVPIIKLLLPVGISFYTFQTMSYTIDIYRGEIKPIENPIKFALFVSFFPQLVAGPIVRASEFLHQLYEEPRFLPTQHMQGLYLIAVGLFKKVAIANYLSINLVDRVFENPSAYSSLEVLFGVYGYALQIYCDFSGYSDVAIGSALLLGFTLPQNFNRPYASVDLQDFWRRWHISLSSWLRDYLYISLGGNRSGSWRTYRNLLITMVLGGLWHGASWNFVIWGILHGGMLAINRAWQRRQPRGMVIPSWRKWLGIVATFHFVCFAWIFFRAPRFSDALEVLESLSQLSVDAPNLTPTLVFMILGTLAVHLSPQGWETAIRQRLLRAPIFAQALLLVVLAVALNQIKGLNVLPFIYFQF